MTRTLLTALCLTLLACGPKDGTLGGACQKSSAAEQMANEAFTGDGDPFYRCDPGLLCNQRQAPFVCEPRRSVGKPCGRDESCEAGLICSPENRCAKP